MKDSVLLNVQKLMNSVSIFCFGSCYMEDE